MSKRMTEKAVAQFNKKLEKIFAKYGVEQVKDDIYRFILKTPFGTLLIHPDNEANTTHGCWTIFLRFDSDWKKEEFLEQLSTYTSINKYSGKWNIHTRDSENALIQFEGKMDELGIDELKLIKV